MVYKINSELYIFDKNILPIQEVAQQEASSAGIANPSSSLSSVEVEGNPLIEFKEKFLMGIGIIRASWILRKNKGDDLNQAIIDKVEKADPVLLKGLIHIAAKYWKNFDSESKKFFFQKLLLHPDHVEAFKLAYKKGILFEKEGSDKTIELEESGILSKITALPFSVSNGQDFNDRIKPHVTSVLTALHQIDPNLFLKGIENGKSPYQIALQNNYQEIIDLIPKNISFKDGSPLYVMCVAGKDEQAVYLFGQGYQFIDKDEQDIGFEFAVKNGCINTVKAMLKSNTSLLTNSDPKTSFIHLAIESGSIEMVNFIIENKVPLKSDQKGQTPLAFAFSLLEKGNGNFQSIISKLLEATSVDDLTKLDQDGRQALYYAIAAGDAKNAETILSKITQEGKINQMAFVDIKGQIPLCILAHQKGLLGIRNHLSDLDPQGNTVAHYAAKGGFIDVLNDLKTEGYDFSVKNNMNKTPYDVGEKLDIFTRELINPQTIQAMTETQQAMAGIKDLLSGFAKLFKQN